MSIEYRPGWRQMPWFVLLFPGYGIVRMLLAGQIVAGLVFLAFVAVFVAAEVIWLRRTTGTDLTQDALVIRGWGGRVIPWERIRSVDTGWRLAARVVRLDVGGRTVQLYVPRHMPFLAPDPDFAEKAATIERWWRERLPTSAGSGP